MEKEVSSLCYKTWFEPVIPVSIDINSIVLCVKAEFNKNYLEHNFMDLMKNAVKSITHKDYIISFVLESDIKKNDYSHPGGANGSNGNGGVNGYSGGYGPNGINGGYGVYGGFYPNGQNGYGHNITLLNSKYTFDTFVIGSGNRLAHAASVAVAESMAKAYNPLFLYGEAGLGKTHLMHAIGNHILSQNPGIKVIYVPSEKFTNELINAIKDDKTVEFRLRYRIADLFLLDDVQFISRKERTQEEFFHTFNELYDAGKQIVITSDKKPGDLPLFEDRLKSRFEWGLTADIQPPDFETRIAILRKKAQIQDIHVSDDVMTYIAENIPSNIRKLEGALNRILAYASLTDYELSVSIAEEALKDIISSDSNREITSNLIINSVCKYFDLRDDDFISSKKRNKEIVFPRQIAMYLCREHAGMSLPQIGFLFGGRDHTTVMHALKKVNEGILTSGEIKRMIEALVKDIRGE